MTYFFKKSRLSGRQTRLMSGYKSRSGTTGRLSRLFNIEELATLWHFPIEAVVKAPLISKASGRKSAPPDSVPLEDLEESNSEVFASSGIFEDEVLSGEHASAGGASIFEDEVTDKHQNNKNSNGLPEFFKDEDEPDDSPSKKDHAPGNLPFV